jgi:hypothetical protein
MSALFHAALEILSLAADYDGDAEGAISLIQKWSTIFGQPTPAEVEMAADRTAFFVYAVAIVEHSIRTQSNPTSARALNQSRQEILDWAQQRPENLALVALSLASVPGATGGPT